MIIIHTYVLSVSRLYVLYCTVLLHCTSILGPRAVEQHTQQCHTSGCTLCTTLRHILFPTFNLFQQSSILLPFTTVACPSLTCCGWLCRGPCHVLSSLVMSCQVMSYPCPVLPYPSCLPVRPPSMIHDHKHDASGGGDTLHTHTHAR